MKKKNPKIPCSILYYIKLKIPNTDANQLLMNYLNKSNEYSVMLQSVVQETIVERISKSYIVIIEKLKNSILPNLCRDLNFYFLPKTLSPVTELPLKTKPPGFQEWEICWYFGDSHP